MRYHYFRQGVSAWTMTGSARAQAWLIDHQWERITRREFDHLCSRGILDLKPTDHWAAIDAERTTEVTS